MVAIDGQPRVEDAWIGLTAALITGSLAWLAWKVPPVYVVSAAVVLTPLAGHWEAIGVPGPLSLDRLLLLTAILVALLRAALAGELRSHRLTLRPVHWALLVVVIYATISALASGSLFENEPFFRLLQIFGVLPFVLFVIAPLIFRTERDTDVLLVALVGLGAYLGLTAIFETFGPKALVYPQYILDPGFGIHADRARGPFVEAVTNGAGLFICAAAASVGAARWRGDPRLVSGAVAVLCTFGTFLTLQRSVWLATAVAILVMAVTVRQLRRLLVPAVIAVGLAIAVALAAVPGFADQAEERRANQGSIRDRQNSNSAAVRMVMDRPLTGFGWGQYRAESKVYYRLNPEYPLTSTDVHNMFLAYAVDLGLPGITLWALAFALGVGRAIGSRGPPEARPMQLGLVAVTVFFLVVVSFVPPTVFPNLLVWLWAGVVWSTSLRVAERPTASR